MSDLLDLSATELAELVRAGEVSATELVRGSLDRIAARDPALNAFLDVDGERALQAAAAVAPGDGRPFAGVPIAIKNNRAWAGRRLTHGTALLRDHVADHDDALVARLLRAGFIPVGTTTMPEHGTLPTTEPAWLAPTRNPWDRGRTAGGSSGGSAVAVAAGMVPVAHGNDGGGSIRIPAACCGLVGLKPQRGRVSVAPDQAESLLVCDGVLTRTVADTAALLDVLAGYEPGDASWAPPPERSFAAQAAQSPGGMRIAVTCSSPIPDVSVDPIAAGAVDEAAALLRELGHEVLEIDPPWPGRELQEAFGVMFCVLIALGIQQAAQLAGGREPVESDVEPMNWAIWQRCQRIEGMRLEAARAHMLTLARRLIAELERYDAVLTPALAERPLPLGSLPTDAPQPMSTFSRSGRFTPFTQIFNVTGQPAVSVPLLQGPDGLPLAVQLAGRPAQEGPLLALAAQLEQARPWAGRRPPL